MRCEDGTRLERLQRSLALCGKQFNYLKCVCADSEILDVAARVAELKYAFGAKCLADFSHWMSYPHSQVSDNSVPHANMT